MNGLTRQSPLGRGKKGISANLIAQGVVTKSQEGYSIIDWRFIASGMNENRSPMGTNEEATEMANSYISLYIHVVFSTKGRQPLIVPDIQNRLWAYMGGIARENQMKALSVGGMNDHAHILLSLPATLPVAKAVQLIKGGASKWVHDTFPHLRQFAWQEGYGAFSVNVSLLEETMRYIESQAEHHKRKTFQEEYIEFLKRHGIGYDERYVWG